MADILELSELLIARLCHDLAGPIGAVKNGVEILKDPSPTLRDESVELIEISAREAVARLLYFRQAYGTSKNNTGISLAAVKVLVSDFYHQKNLTFNWPEAHGDSDSMQPIKADMVKLILNMILIVAGSLIHGGSVTIKLKNVKNALAVKVRGEGKAVKLQEHLARPLANDFKEAEIDSRNVQAYLTATLAKRIGSKINVELSDKHIELVAT